jgi:YVTN family beta-propeller protein
MRRACGQIIFGGRSARVAVLLLSVAVWLSCGDTFRPIEIPVPSDPGDPQPFHTAFVISDNGINNPGTMTQIDVSGDTNVGVVNVGRGPAHVALLPPSSTRAYIANLLDNTVSSFQISTGGVAIGAVTTTVLPPGSAPVFLASSEAANMYVAESGTNKVGVISSATNVLVAEVGVGTQPVALAETPDGKKLYSINQGSNNVTVIDTTDRSVITTLAVGSSPVLAAARSDSAFIYVLNGGSNSVSVIDTLSQTVTGTLSVPAGANSMFYDRRLNRLLVTSGSAGAVSIFDASVSMPTLLKTLTVAANPIGVTALADGTRAYILSAQIGSTIDPTLTVINELTNVITKTIPLASLNPLAGCGSVSHRLAIASDTGSSRVYVSSCDAGSTSIIRTSDDAFVLDIPSPVSALPPLGPGQQPPPQTPVLVVTGR